MTNISEAINHLEKAIAHLGLGAKYRDCLTEVLLEENKGGNFIDLMNASEMEKAEAMIEVIKRIKTEEDDDKGN